MSDIEVPNIEFDTETSLTEGPGHDDFPGTSGNDLFVGAIAPPSGLTTLNPADIIRGGDGGDDMLSVTMTGSSPQAVGFLTSDIDVIQVRNFVSDEAYMNMIDVTGTSTLWLDNNTGDTEFEFVQNLVDVVVTGGDFSADINYMDSVAGGANQDQEILVQGVADGDIDINGGVQNLWLQANGAPSDIDIDSDATNVMVMGDSASLVLDLDSGADVATFDSTAFAGTLNLDADVGNGNGTVTVDTNVSDDTLDLDSNSSSTVEITTRNGDDDVEIDGAYRVEVLAGYGDDTVEAGIDSQIGSGGVDIRTALGDDHVEVRTSGNADVYTGKGADTVELQNVGGDAFLSTGNLDDVITNAGGVQGHLEALLGWGNDSLTTYAGGGAHITAAKGDDVINITGSYEDVTILGGGGNNTMTARITGNWDDDGTFQGGSGVDTVNFYGYGHLNAALLDGNDVVNANRVDEQMNLSLGEGDDLLDLSYSSGSDGNLNSSDTVMGEGGNDTIRAWDIDNLRNGNSFLNTSSVEGVVFEYNDSSSFYGDSTGANAAGVMTYDFLSNLNTSTYLYQLADDVTLNMRDNSGLNYFRLDLDDSGGATTANLNFSNTASGSGSTGFNTMDLTDVGTLNVIVSDDYNDYPTNITNTTVLGSGSSFLADPDLTTVTLAGSTHVEMGAVSASGLSTIDASGMDDNNVYLDLVDVADAVNAKDPSIVITTAAGNDEIVRGDSSANYAITTDRGDDTVSGSGGNDNVMLGDGNDLVQFSNASDLDAFDTVNGGADTDTLQIMNGGIIGDDNAFFLISEVENWILSNSQDTLTMGNIAQTSGIERIDLGNGNNTLTLKDSYTSALEVTIGTSGYDTVDAGASSATLTVKARSSDVDSGDVITGGTGLMDELVFTDVNGDAYLYDVEGIEKVTIAHQDQTNAYIHVDDDTVATGGTLTVTTNTSYIYQGDLNFYGSSESDGNFVVTGGWGNDYIYGGALGDTINTNQGSDTVYGNDGADSISVGDGDDSVYGGAGDDTIDGGAGNDTLAGDYFFFPSGGSDNDVINAGAGADTIFGNAGADTIDAGLEDGDIDTLHYAFLSDSSGSAVDQVSNFESGVGGDIIDLSSIPDWAYAGTMPYVGMEWQGNRSDFGQTQGVMFEDDGIIQVAFDMDTGTLWADLNDDGTLNANDLQIDLIGVELNGGLDAANVLLPV